MPSEQCHLSWEECSPFKIWQGKWQVQRPRAGQRLDVSEGAPERTAHTESTVSIAFWPPSSNMIFSNNSATKKFMTRKAM